MDEGICVDFCPIGEVQNDTDPAIDPTLLKIVTAGTDVSCEFAIEAPSPYHLPDTSIYYYIKQIYEDLTVKININKHVMLGKYAELTVFQNQ